MWLRRPRGWRGTPSHAAPAAAPSRRQRHGATGRARLDAKPHTTTSPCDGRRRGRLTASSTPPNADAGVEHPRQQRPRRRAGRRTSSRLRTRYAARRRGARRAGRPRSRCRAAELGRARGSSPRACARPVAREPPALDDAARAAPRRAAFCRLQRRAAPRSAAYGGGRRAQRGDGARVRPLAQRRALLVAGREAPQFRSFLPSAEPLSIIVPRVSSAARTRTSTPRAQQLSRIRLGAQRRRRGRSRGRRAAAAGCCRRPRTSA